MQFDGLRTLVVEDNALLSMMLQDMLRDIGCTITGAASDMAQAMAMAQGLELDFAILDLNIEGDVSYAIADVLAARGVPCLFATGYAPTSLPGRFQSAAIIAKPFLAEELSLVMSQVLARP